MRRPAEGLGLRVWGRIQGLGFIIWGFWFGFRVRGFSTDVCEVLELWAP